jgi:hypothetical protein
MDVTNNIREPHHLHLPLAELPQTFCTPAALYHCLKGFGDAERIAECTT